jgi:hypothetical protein
VSAYEDEHYAIDPPNPVDAIVERMADRGMSRADLGELIGAPSGRVLEILNCRRPLTIDMIRKLAEGLGWQSTACSRSTSWNARTPDMTATRPTGQLTPVVSLTARLRPSPATALASSVADQAVLLGHVATVSMAAIRDCVTNPLPCT